MFKDELLISDVDLEAFQYDWQLDSSHDLDLVEHSIELSQDSESSFDPMAAKIVDFKTMKYNIRKQRLGLGTQCKFRLKLLYDSYV